MRTAQIGPDLRLGSEKKENEYISRREPEKDHLPLEKKTRWGGGGGGEIMIKR